MIGYSYEIREYLCILCSIDLENILWEYDKEKIINEFLVFYYWVKYFGNEIHINKY